MYNYTLELRQLGNPFDFEYDFYDEQFKCNFEEKFIKHYYFNEIGFETIERFKQRLEAKLILNMPYWTQLYETELAAEGIEFLLNKDLKETFLRTVDTEDKIKGTASSNSTGTSSDSSNSSMDTSGTSNNKISNIADGVASVSLDQNFLTGVSEDKSEGTSTSTSKSNGNTSNNSTGSNTEDRNGKLLEKTEFLSQGNIGVTSSAELLEKWRSVLINIDKIIIDDCYDLFLGIF